MNRVNSGNGDSDRQPASVRSRLKTRIMFEGKPKDIDEFILRLLTEADVIATANAEMMACGVNYRPIGKVGDRITGQQGQQTDNAGKDKAKAAAAAAKAAGGVAFVCNGCGGTGHKYKECNKTAHPDFNSSKLAWALSDVGKRLAAAGKTHIGYDKGDKPKWQTKKGAVLDNYCSEAVGDWVREHHPDCWDADINTEPVDLACIGSSAVPLVMHLAIDTRDAADQLSVPILQPAKPVGGQSRKKAPDVGLLTFIPVTSHTPGKPFLGSVDVRMKKHVSELLDITEESYGMLGEDSELFPDASTPLTVEGILAAVQIEGHPTLQTAVRALVKEFADIFSNDKKSAVR
ncbi:hypothetical protein B484DRAFT_407649 [Ochromonadaceae sp. CCMP2298]|nr:hypothetical protein B484DRAFT_407649 [Ochromonadaceae sp. CCMP2298]